MATLMGILAFVQPPKVCAKDITPNEAASVIKNADDKLCVVDVRTPKEYGEGHLPSAINLNVLAPNFPQMLQTLDKSAPTLVYCRSGRRSKLAVTIMEGMGFSHILHMKDGWIAWEKSQLPIDHNSH
ncbi:MAG: rhodanese-like domain-containing protein [Desulfovibrio sp.]|nr:rhodanese-like domain-containing protein [Desulfovibrio sp.]